MPFSILFFPLISLVSIISISCLGGKGFVEIMHCLESILFDCPRQTNFQKVYFLILAVNSEFFVGFIILQYLSRWNKISQKSFLNINFCRLPRPSIRFRLVLCDNKPSLLAVHRNFIPCVKSCSFQPSTLQKNLRWCVFKSTPSFINCHSVFFHRSSLSVASLHTISNIFPLSVRIC